MTIFATFSPGPCLSKAALGRISQSLADLNYDSSYSTRERVESRRSRPQPPMDPSASRRSNAGRACVAHVTMAPDRGKPSLTPPAYIDGGRSPVLALVCPLPRSQTAPNCSLQISGAYQSPYPVSYQSPY